jgi:hypothetical protein
MKHDIYEKFGKCWNIADFSSFSKKLLRDCTYDSFDYFYKLKGRQRLMEYFNETAAQNKTLDENERIYVHKGYCQKTDSMLKTIKECCIMVRQSDLKTTKILVFNKRFGKVSTIVGMDPGQVKSIRDIKF